MKRLRKSERHALILSHMDLARWEARDQARKHPVQNESEWLSHSLEYLVRAAQSYDPSKCGFKHHAKLVIRRSYIDWLRAHGKYRRGGKNKAGVKYKDPKNVELNFFPYSYQWERTHGETPESIFQAIQDLRIKDNRVLEIF